MKLALALIEENGGTQSRAALNSEKVAEYSEVITQLPPVVVFYDGTKYWLADGFHRVAAAVNVNATEIETDVRQGSLRDAIFFSFSANASHGIPRSIADKRRAVERMLGDEEWSAWSDRKIADACRVSHTFVAGVRRPKAETPANVATSTASGIRPYGGNVATTPEPVRPLSPVPAESGVTARNDDELRAAARLEGHAERFLTAFHETSPAARRMARPVLEGVLRQLSRAMQESAA